jgi:hypothetical protein
MTTTQPTRRRGMTLEQILQAVWKTDPTITIARAEEIIDEFVALGYVHREWEEEADVIDAVPEWPTVQ